jgi:hypothetical protein
MVVRIANGECADWMLAHEALSRLAKARARAEFEEGKWLVAAFEAEVHRYLGYGSFNEYIERLFGYSPRTTQEKLRVAEALELLPKTAEALAGGVLNWSVARELTRVAIAETEEEWLRTANGMTARQVEALVNGRSPGDLPATPSNPEVRRYVLRFEVRAETLATFREAVARLRKDCPVKMDDDSALLLMARHLLGGPADSGRASYQIAMKVCPRCDAGAQQACGEMIPVAPEVVDMTQCDAQHIGEVDEHAHVGGGQRATQTIPPATRRKVMRRDHGRCVVPGCTHTQFVDVHHIRARADGGDHDEDYLIVTCSAHHRAAHDGRLIIEGSVSTGLVFRHADGSNYGGAVSPNEQDLQTKLFGALRDMGFGERETREALNQARETLPEEGDASALLRAALLALTDPGS